MRRRNLFLGFQIVLLLVGLAGLGGCDESPTEPEPPLPDVAGSWTGFWSIGSFGLRTTMNLDQDDDGRVSGSLTVIGVAHSIVGTVTPTRFTWRLANLPEGECPDFAGDMELTLSGETVTRMSGTATQDNLACDPDGLDMTGPMTLSRVMP